MKTCHRLYLALIFAVALFSCSRETYDEPAPAEPGKSIEAVVSLNLRPDIVDTKSSMYNEDIISELHNVVVYGVDETAGEWKRAYIDVKGSSVTARMSFFTGHDLTFYALGNMGDVDLPTNPSGELTPEVFSYLIDNDANFSIAGFPMAGKLTVSASEFTASSLDASRTLSLPLQLDRLVAKVVVSIDKTAITGGVSAPVLSSNIISIHQANRRMRPFHPDGSAALSPSDLFSGAYEMFDAQFFTSGEAASQHADIVLYVPENRHGQIIGGNWSLNTPSDIIGEGSLCTYIEYLGRKDGTNDGVGGDIYYRGFLGNSSLDSDDFSVCRNTLYTASLSLTWNGLVWNADGWRIDTDDVTDGRRLVLSSSNNSLAGITGNSLGKMKRNASKEVFVNFSRDGGSSWIHNAKDLDDWPYGWDIYVDGVKQAAGFSGQADGVIGWSYDGSPSADRLTVTPGAQAALRTTHTLQVKSADGKVASNVVTFDVSAPLGLQWDAGAPGYVAQRGRLVAAQLDKPTATVEYTVTSGSKLVRLSAAANRQSQMVNILGAGEVTILATCEETGQDEEITFTVAAPELRLNTTACYVNPDGAEAKTGTTGLSGSSISASYNGASGTLSRRVTSATATAVGSYLAADLYDELLAVRPSVTTPLLATSCPSGYGTITLHAKALHAGGDSYPEMAGTTIGYISVAPKDASTGIAPARIPVRSVDPFSAFPSSVTLNTAKDIQDFSVIGLPNNFTRAYTNTTYSTTLPTVSASTGYYGLAARLYGETENDEELAGLFSLSGSTVSWNSISASRTRYKAGTFYLEAYVENRHSHEKWYSNPFFRGRLFVHGSVIAKGVSEMIDYMSVYTDYLGIDAAYSVDGLGAAWPSVCTTHTNSVYNIIWAWGEDGMFAHDGACSVTEVHNKDKRVTQRNGLLFKVHDDCGYSHDRDPQWHECWFTGPNTDGGPRMEFLPAPTNIRDEDYQHYSEGRLKYINKDLMFIHPDGSETHAYNGVGGCGYYPMHISQWIRDQIM